MTGSGSIVSYAVKDGDTVERGQLLFETLDGSFDGLYMSGSDIYAGVDGIVGSVNASKGGSVQKNSVVAVIYPTGSMRIEGSVNESDLADIAVGDPVEIEMNWNEGEDNLLTGTVSMISAVANAGESVTYTVYIDFTPDASTRYGMTCVVSTIETEKEEPEEEAVEEAVETTEETQTEEHQRGERPEGMELPEGAELPEGMELPDGAQVPSGN